MIALAERAEIERDAYRPSVTPKELDAIKAGLTVGEHRRVTLGRLFTIDLPKAVRRYARGFTRDERETLRTEALMLLIRWESVGRSDPMPLGGADATPYRRDWIGDDGTLTAGAWRAMRAALKQAARTAEIRTAETTAHVETPTDELPLAALAEAEAEAARDATPMPELRAEMIADAMGLSLSASRALLYRAYGMSPTDAAASWNIAPGSVPVIVSRGTAEIARRYPEAADLLTALRDVRAAALNIESALADEARLALAGYVDGATPRRRAEQVAIEWLSVARMLPESRRVLIGATRRHCREAQARLVASALPMLVSAASSSERACASRPGAGQVLTARVG